MSYSDKNVGLGKGTVSLTCPRKVRMYLQCGQRVRGSLRRERTLGFPLELASECIGKSPQGCDC